DGSRCSGISTTTCCGDMTDLTRRIWFPCLIRRFVRCARLISSTSDRLPASMTEPTRALRCNCRSWEPKTHLSSFTEHYTFNTRNLPFYGLRHGGCSPLAVRLVYPPVQSIGC